MDNTSAVSREDAESINWYLDEIHRNWHSTVPGQRSSELHQRCGRVMRAAGIKGATAEIAVSWALNGRRIKTDDSEDR